MNQFGINFTNHWNGRELRLTTHASRELTVVKLDLYDLIPALDTAVRCPNTKRKRRTTYACCLSIQGKEYQVIIEDDVIRDFELEPCWVVKHIKPFTWSNNM